VVEGAIPETCQSKRKSLKNGKKQAYVDGVRHDKARQDAAQGEKGEYPTARVALTSLDKEIPYHMFTVKARSSTCTAFLPRSNTNNSNPH
jgi:hypothetical protein